MIRLREKAILATALVLAGACSSGHPPTTGHPGVTTTTAPATVPTVGAGGPGTVPSTVPGAPAGHPAPAAPAGPVSVRAAAVAPLTPFDSCPAFLSSVKAEATSEVTPWGLAWSPSGGVLAQGGMMALDGPVPGAPARGAAAATAAAPASNAAGSAGAATPAFSTTNDQEAAVDEPDLAKTDGHLLVTLRTGAIVQVTDVSGARPALRGSLQLPQGAATGLFLVGSDVVVVGTSYDQGSSSSTATAWVVSVADPDHPALARTFGMAGVLQDARLIAGTVKLVVASGPRLVFPPSSGSEGQAVATNRAVIARSTVADWLPVVTDPAGRRSLAPCTAVSHGGEPDGVGMLSVLSIQPDQSRAGTPVTVLGDPGTVYASATTLYVATTNWAEQVAQAGGRASAGERSVIHAFDISNPTRTTYVGSGAVPGVLLNSYAMSADGGYLRVATTTGTPTPPPGEGEAPPAADGSQSLVTVLRPEGTSLAAVGQVGGLGQGEHIVGVRFVGSLGYVVTFRQLDPLIVVDLSDPTRPAVRGTLGQLTGYSAYLQPVGSGLLLGIGASADANARRTGEQVSLFDIADPAHPRMVNRDELPGASAAVDNDPHAFLWWAPRSLAIVPLDQYPSNGTVFNGAVAFRVTPGGVTEVGRVSPPATTPACPPNALCAMPEPPAPGAAAPVGGGGGAAAFRATDYPCCYPGSAGIQRVLIVGDRLFSVSPAGVLVSDLASFAQVVWLPYS